MATITPLTDLDAVKARLNIPLADTDNDVELTLIISAVTERIYKYCNRNFTKQMYVYTDRGTNDNIVILPNKPINDIFYKAKGSQGVITVTYTGSSIASLEVEINDLEQLFTLKTVEATAETNTLLLTTAKSITALAAELNGLANWTAVVETSYGDYPSLSLLMNSYQSLESDDQMCLRASVWGMQLSKVRQFQGLYDADSVIAQDKPYVIIYNGGYLESAIPDDLKDVATQISANTFNLGQQDQNLQSEKIGDYAWTRSTGDFLTQVLPGWYTNLAPYKNPSMG